MKAGPVLLSLMALAACDGPDMPAATNQQGEHQAPVENMIAPIGNLADRGNAIAPPPADMPQAELSPAEEATPPTPASTPAPEDYRAIGTEPFWAVRVHGSIATLERPDKPPAHYSVSRTDDAKAIRYLGDGFAMTATQGPCSDGMSDTIWSDRVQLSFDGGTLKGCGGDRDDSLQAP